MSSHLKHCVPPMGSPFGSDLGKEESNKPGEVCAKHVVGGVTEGLGNGCLTGEEQTDPCSLSVGHTVTWERTEMKPAKG